MIRVLALLAALAASPAFAGTIYVDTGGSATNSGSTDQNSANLTGSAATDATLVITLDGSPDLSGVVTTAGPTQSSIYLTNSTVANRKIYWITAKDDVLDTVTVDTAPACTAGACGAWAIGGRFVWTAASIEAALRAGDQVTINNSPASASADWITGRTAGDSTSGYIKIVGKTGVRPVITVTNTNQVVEGGNQTFWWFENLEMVQQGASGSVVQGFGSRFVLNNVKITDGGGVGVQNSNNTSALTILNSEITGVGGDGINSGCGTEWVYGSYVHDVGGDCVEFTASSSSILNTVIDTCAGRGIYFSLSTTGVTLPSFVFGVTAYGSGNSGLEVLDKENRVLVQNSIFSENGNAAGEYNVEWVEGAAETIGYHANNDFYSSGGGGSGNLFGLTANSTEITTDPLLTNPASGDFTLQTGSPAISIGYPGQLLGATGQGYLDLGPQQRQPSSGGAHVVGG